MLQRSFILAGALALASCSSSSGNPGPTPDTGVPDSSVLDAGAQDSGSDVGAGGGATCGDGVRQGSETCDDGNAVTTDGCLPGCVSASCGDGVVRTDLTQGNPGYESCDDGNGVDGDACPDGPSGRCQPAACGDGIVRSGAEQCDDGNTASGDGCSATCQFETATCGNGAIGGGEQCDLGPNNSDTAAGACPAVCRTNCSCPRCGDGVADFPAGEECDDLNTNAGDGCDATCHIEAAPTCGNGTLDLVNDEECDDGNVVNGDGCDDACQFEPVGASCGDNVTQSLERCDDGNLANGDGCNPTCNLNTQVTTLATGLLGRGLAVSDGTIFLGSCNSATNTVCSIDAIDIGTCFSGGSCAMTRLAGGTCGPAVDGVGANAVLGCVESMTTDGSRLWFAGVHTLRELDVTTGRVTTVAGDITKCGAVDGVGTGAYFHDIRGVTYHGGFVYLLDGCENVLRRFDPRTGIVVTLAGTRTPDPTVLQTGPTAYTCSGAATCPATVSTDGYGLAAIFGSPRYLTADGAGNLYIVDTNGQSIRSYNTVTGYVGTLFGGAGYVDGVAGAVRIERPRGIASDGTSVYWCEQNSSTVRQGIIGTRSVSTLAGVRGCTGMQDGTGGLGMMNYSAVCAANVGSHATFTNPLGGFAFHGRTSSLLVIESGRLRRIR